MRGSYGYRDASGVYRIVEYVADASGFKATIKSNEPGIGNAQAANILLNSELPPPSLLIPTAPVPAPRTVFPGREPRNRGFTSFDVNHAAASSEHQVVRNERLRYRFPLPSGAVPAAVDSEQPTAAPTAASTTAVPLPFLSSLYAERIRSNVETSKKLASASNRQ